MTVAIEDRLATAIALRLEGRLDEAEPVLRELVSRAPKDARPWANLGQLLRDLGRLDEAVAALRRAAALAPEQGPILGVLGDCLHRMGRLNAADAVLRRSIEHGCENNAAAWTLLANNSRYLGKVDDVEGALTRAAELEPGSPDMHNNIAVFLTTVGRFDEALAHFEQSIAIAPDNRRWYQNRGFTRLIAGDVEGGWTDYEFALHAGGARGDTTRVDLPRWTPAQPAARVLCSREQGVGDEILFASCLPDLAAGTRVVVYESDPRLVSLFARSFPSIEVWPQDLDRPATDFDAGVLVGSLPLHFRRAVHEFPPDRRSYLVPDEAAVERWRTRMGALGRGPVIALSWRSKLMTAERRLEYTRLTEDWGPIFAIPGVTWVSAQYDDCERELADAEHKFGVTIHRFDDVDYLDDFDEVAALLSACDLTLAPRNAVAMLAGALGVPTVMMGNRWDWADLGTDTSPWFPSVQLAYRQWGDDWNDVIAAAAARVEQLTPDKESLR
ncbi:MAG: tetratricopeptide repeat protein [Actinomycetota bacterium]|nr:tetratricopeptide repeat protein [Actinomycetota bacterium]